MLSFYHVLPPSMFSSVPSFSAFFVCPSVFQWRLLWLMHMYYPFGKLHVMVYRKKYCRKFQIRIYINSKLGHSKFYSLLAWFWTKRCHPNPPSTLSISSSQPNNSMMRLGPGIWLFDLHELDIEIPRGVNGIVDKPWSVLFESASCSETNCQGWAKLKLELIFETQTHFEW